MVVPPCLALSLRPTVGRFLHCQICLDSLAVTDLSISEYLKFKERLASAPPFSVYVRLQRQVCASGSGHDSICAAMVSQTAHAYSENMRWCPRLDYLLTFTECPVRVCRV